MKKILGLDLGTTSIGWALVNEAENDKEISSIIKIGVRVNPLTVDEQQNFEKGKSITTNADRTLKRSARRNLQRYKLRRENLVEVLKRDHLITNDTFLSEQGNKTTFETYRLRALAATKEVSLGEFARILLMINKKRGYKSSRKAKSQEEGQLIDGMEVAMKLYDEGLTPGQYVFKLLSDGAKYIPDFYRSDLQEEFNRIWDCQKQFYSEILTNEFRVQILGKSKKNTSAVFLAKYGIYTAENKADNKKLQAYKWRVDALTEELNKEELAYVISDLNGAINNSSGYLGAISDRSKELHFKRQTVGQYLMEKLSENPNYSLKNRVFYRQDYLDEFNTIWETQASFHKELTQELKSEVRDIIIFYQRRLKSQKGLINHCEFESRDLELEIDGKKVTKTIGPRVCPKSSPVFQEYKIWQNINNIEVKDKQNGGSRLLYKEEKEVLFEEVNLKAQLKKEKVLKLLFNNPEELDLNFKTVEGNRTQAELFNVYCKIIELSGHGSYSPEKMGSKELLGIVKEVFAGLGYKTDFLEFDIKKEGKEFERQPMFKLWHLLYSFEGDNSKTGNESLINKIVEITGFEKEYAAILANVNFSDDYGNLSTKAMRKILPYMMDGNEYSLACGYAGYRHSKNSLSKEEIENKSLVNKLENLPKNSLRNPVVEKILNQMINVVNAVVDTYGKPDEIRIELARELKKNAREREEMTNAINKATADHEKFKKILQTEFGLSHVSRNDIIRYKLYLELEEFGFHTLYSNKYIPAEKLFSKEFDIEHIIPQSRLFDDSFSNKTLESRDINIEKGNDTAYDYISNKYGEKGLDDYLLRIERLYENKKISKAKYNKLKMQQENIPEDFIQRDLRDSQYIARKAKSILEDMVWYVVPTTGSVTDRLREDWQLVDVMQELNWGKYDKLGLTEIIENRDGHKIKRIKEWTKRNDHRHHAMDALTIAFTKRSYIQYLNNLNARSNKSGSIYGIETKELYKDHIGKLRFKPPIPLDEFRAEAKKHLENTLISIKAKNKVATVNINKTKGHNRLNKKKQLTPRGQLHLETVYGSIQQYLVKEEKVGTAFTQKHILQVAKKKCREALLKRLQDFNNDPKKAFTGKNNLSINPVWLNPEHTMQVPEKVKLVDKETVYTIRKEITPDLKIEKVIDKKIRQILEDRLEEYNGDSKKAFSNLNENPIWLNKEKGISIKRVTISGINNALALHDKKDKEGNLVLDAEGKTQPVDFVNTGNNHHVAVYKDADGNLQENVVTFFEAVTRVNLGLPVIDKEYKKEEGWQFQFTMKQNEYFVFPNEQTGFNPSEIDLLDPENNYLISPNLFRVQKIASKDYFFRHHLETNVENNNVLKGITWLRLGLSSIENIAKVRINHLGQIVAVREY